MCVCNFYNRGTFHGRPLQTLHTSHNQPQVIQGIQTEVHFLPLVKCLGLLDASCGKCGEFKGVDHGRFLNYRKHTHTHKHLFILGKL